MLETWLLVRLKTLAPLTRRLLSFGAGVVSILAMAPFFLWPVLYVTLPVLMLVLAVVEAEPASQKRGFILSRSRIGRAASVGWWFGLGYHLAGTFWIGEAFLVEAHIFGWLLPFAVLGMAAGLGLFSGLATAFAAMASPPRIGLPRVVALTIGLGLTEWLRGHLFTGFPWNVVGYAFAAPPMILSASLIGIYALTLVVVFCALLPMAGRAVWGRSRAVVYGTAALCLLPVVAFTLYTSVQQASTGPTSVDTAPRVRLVQPSVPQHEKWQPANARRIFDDHLLLSLSAASGSVDHARGIALIVWPEAAMPFLPLESDIAMDEIGAMLTQAPLGTVLMAGALRVDQPSATGDRRVYNSLIGFQAGTPAKVLHIYDKIHLVPFGEYLPMQALLERLGLQQLSRLRGGFAAGPKPRPSLEAPGIGTILPLICYEVIFPGQLVQSGARPRVIVNVTNDGWFGNTTGPRQHLHMAQVRAAEEGVPIIRAANNGISAIIDGQGRILAQIGLNVRGTVDGAIPPSLGPPLYSRMGDTFFWLFLILGTLFLFRNHNAAHP